MVYVDKVKLFCLKASTIDELKVFFTKYYKLCNIAKVELYLEIEINGADRLIIFNQTKYMNNLLEKYKIQDINPASTFMIEVKLKRALDGYICEL